MSALIDQAVATKPDGLVVSIPEPPAWRRRSGARSQAGIPVVSINSGSDVFRSLGVLAHVGQIEEPRRAGGRAAGSPTRASGARSASTSRSATPALDARCAGLAKAMREAGGERARVLAIVDDDPRTPGADRAAPSRADERRRRAGHQLARRARRGRGPARARA